MTEGDQNHNDDKQYFFLLLISFRELTAKQPIAQRCNDKYQKLKLFWKKTKM